MAGTLTDHIKKLKKKDLTQKFQIRNIDFIYCINLDRRPERLRHCNQQFSVYDIIPHRVPGINGWSYTQDVFNDIAMILLPYMEYDRPVHFRFVPMGIRGEFIKESSYGRPCVHEGSPAGGLGGAMTHLSILEDARLSKYKVIWILEDDFTIKHNPHILADFIDQLDQLDPNWDVLYTDDDAYFSSNDVSAHYNGDKWLKPGLPMTKNVTERTALGENFFKIGGRTQAHSVIYSYRGIEKIANYLKRERFFLPYDTEIPCVPDIRIYNLKYDIVHGRDRHFSDTSHYWM